MAKLLLIEDEPQVQKYMTYLLQRWGHELVVAGNGQAGLEKAADPAIELMLVDLQLPGALQGMDLVKQIRAVRPECPIVIMSGYPTPERMEECRALGISDFLTKPFEVRFVISVITRILAQKNAPAESPPAQG